MSVSPEEGGAANRDARNSWRGRHYKTVMGTMLGGWIAVTGFGGYMGEQHGERAERASNTRHSENVAQYRKCLTVVEKNAKPGSKTAIIRLASLTSQEQVNCGFAGLKGAIDDAVNYSYLPQILDGKLISPEANPEVQLPSINRLKAAIPKEALDAADFGYSKPAEDAAIGTMIGLLAGMGGLAGIGFGIGYVDKRRGIVHPSPETNGAV
jgi:hypothetical protein